MLGFNHDTLKLRHGKEKKKVSRFVNELIKYIAIYVQITLV